MVDMAGDGGVAGTVYDSDFLLLGLMTSYPTS